MALLRWRARLVALAAALLLLFASAQQNSHADEYSNIEFLKAMRDTLRSREGFAVKEVEERLRVGGGKDDDDDAAAGSPRKPPLDDPRVKKRVRVVAPAAVKDRLRGGARPDSQASGAAAAQQGSGAAAPKERLPARPPPSDLQRSNAGEGRPRVPANSGRGGGSGGSGAGADRPQKLSVERLQLRVGDEGRLRSGDEGWLRAAARNSSAAGAAAGRPPIVVKGAAGSKRRPPSRVRVPEPVETTDAPPNGTTLPRNWDRTGAVSWTHAVVLEQHKLIFCALTKCGSTQWRRMLRRLNGAERDYLKRDPHNPLTNGLQLLHKLPTSKVAAMVADPSYTKAIFVRSPVTRVLSGYRDKIEVSRPCSSLARGHGRGRRSFRNRRFFLFPVRTAMTIRRARGVAWGLSVCVGSVVPPTAPPLPSSCCHRGGTSFIVSRWRTGSERARRTSRRSCACSPPPTATCRWTSTGGGSALRAPPQYRLKLLAQMSF